MTFDPISIAIEGEQFLKELGLEPRTVYMGNKAYNTLRETVLPWLRQDPRCQYTMVMGLPLYVQEHLDPWAVIVSPDPPPEPHAQEASTHRPVAGAGVRPRNQRVPTPGPVQDPLLG
jgi:hypothetical protein